MKSSIVKVLLVMLSLVVLSICGLSQQDTKTPPKTDQKMKAEPQGHMSQMADHEFAMKVAMDGMTEVELGQVALTKAESADVKTFAQKMVDDHSKANDELKTLASTKGVTLPTALGAKERKMIDDMSKLSGADFDRKYMEEMVKGHDKAVALFEKEAANGKDAETKAWADTTLPTLREHQKMARDTAAKVGVKVTPMKTENK